MNEWKKKIVRKQKEINYSKLLNWVQIFELWYKTILNIEYVF